MMYTISKNLKLTSIILMVIGFIGLTYGFLAAPSNIEEALKIYPEYGHSPNEVVKVSDRPNDTGYDQQDEIHKEHLLHKLQNRPWAALYVAALFFFFISLGTIAFYAIQRASQSGWSPVLYRVMEGITAYLLPGGIVVFVILFLSCLHFNHLFIWMDADVVAEDKIIRDKIGYLNIPFFLARALFFIFG